MLYRKGMWNLCVFNAILYVWYFIGTLMIVINLSLNSGSYLSHESNNRTRSQGPLTLLIFWWIKYINRLVCTVNVYIPAGLGQRQILSYLQICTHFSYSFRTDSCVSTCQTVFITRHFKYRKQKTQPYLQSVTLFLSIIFRGLF